MRIRGSMVWFDSCDKQFVEKFGVIEATKMVLDFSSHSNTPFVYDMRQLSSYLGQSPKAIWGKVKNANKLYNIYEVPKKSGGKRLLCSPKGDLKFTQRRILNCFLNKMPVSQYATAYVKGKTLVENACPHTGKKHLLKMDISDFFGSITFEQVYSAAFNTRIFPKQIGVALTKLCCRRDVLPQGAPTSPALSNLVMKRFDDYIGSWCKMRGISYTRYCDDMTFSADKPLYNVYEKVKNMLDEMGFEVNTKKTRFVTASSRQSVTGLTVNDHVNVSREYKRELRKEIHYVLKYGLAQNIMNGDKSEFVKNYTPNTASYYYNLIGRINYVLQIEPDNYWFRNALQELKCGEILAEIM